MKSRLATGLAMAFALSACGGGLSGEYGHVSDIDGQWETRFSFSGSQVEVSMMGQTRVGDYRIADGKVYITLGGKTEALKIDGQGCIDGGFLFGRNCRK